jgi:hypothetical protein
MKRAAFIFTIFIILLISGRAFSQNEDVEYGVFSFEEQMTLPGDVPAIVESVWEHFLFERFKPYIEKQ